MKQILWLKKLKEKITKNFINKCIKKYGNEFTYENLIYKNKETSVIITCRKHGGFSMLPCAFTNRTSTSNPCPKCLLEEKTAKFIEQSRIAHNDKYDYSKVNFVNSNTKVEIICPIHGSFYQKPFLHSFQKQKCYRCAKDLERSNTERFIKLSKLKHGDRYDYGKSVYVDVKTKIEIICRTHGSFYQRPGSHFIYGHGCAECAKEGSKLGIEKFIEISNNVHSHKYDYSNSIYIGNKVKLEIICPSHGSFYQKPNSHMSGGGCPSCISSKGESKISEILNYYGIPFIREYKIDGYKYRYDFFLPEQNILIEYQGQQHYYPVKAFGGETGHLDCKKRDILKSKIAAEKMVPLIAIHYKYMYNKTLEHKLIKDLKKIYKYWLVLDSDIIVAKNEYSICQIFNLKYDTPIRDACHILLKNNQNIKLLF